MRNWTEIHSDFEEDCLIFIDAWTTDAGDEAGNVIAKVNKKTREVIYIDERAKTDELAQEVINEVLAAIPTEKEIQEFKENWGQTHSHVTAELGYSKKHSESDELLTEDYFWIEADKKWYNRCASMFSEREQEIADYLYDISFE